jgi:hypothetical protein
MNIDPNARYQPREIAKNGWILNTKGRSSYTHILRLIKAGRLKSTNVGMGKTPYNMVKGQDILDYLETLG